MDVTIMEHGSPAVNPRPKECLTCGGAAPFPANYCPTCAPPEAARFPTCPICQQAALNVITLFIKVDVRCTVCGWEALLLDRAALRETWHRVMIAGLVRLATRYNTPMPGIVTQGWFAADQPLSALDSVEYYLQESARETERTNPAQGLAWATIRDQAAQRECAWVRQQVWNAIAPLLVDTQTSEAL